MSKLLCDDIIKAKINFEFLLITIFFKKTKSSKFQKKTTNFFFEYAIFVSKIIISNKFKV